MTDNFEEWRRKRKAREEADLARARMIPSHYANRAYLRTLDGLTRITFGEQVFQGSDPTNWTFAVTMTTSDAIAVADLIYAQAKAEEDRQAALDTNFTPWEEESQEPDPSDPTENTGNG